MSRLLSNAAGAQGPAALERALVREARAFTGAANALLLGATNGGPVTIAAADPALLEGRAVDPAELPELREALGADAPVQVEGPSAAALAVAAGLARVPTAALLLPAHPPMDGARYVLILADERPDRFSAAEVEAAAAFASAAAASLAQVTLLASHASQMDRQSALARAAKALNESLDLTRVLPRICREAAEILDADTAGVYRGSAADGLVLEATTSAPELIGSRLEPGTGIAARAIELGRPTASSSGDNGGQVKAALAAPMRWDGELRGVLYVGYHRDRSLTDADLALLDSFAELAAIACRNASVHAALGEAARKDALTGCLNHAALHDTLRREMQRSRRTGRRLSVAMVDLDHFKEVNEKHGHLMGDEVLRRVGRALREAVRPYDFVARYGGDEFAIVAVDAREERAAEIADRAISRLGDALTELVGPGPGTHATAGVAEWTGSGTAPELIREADRALLYGKQQGVRGGAVLARVVPDAFELGGPSDDQSPAEGAGPTLWPSAVRRETEPLRRRTRQLSFATELGAKISGLTHTTDIARAALTELGDAFEFDDGAVFRVRDDGTLGLCATLATGGAGAPSAGEAIATCIADRVSVLIDAGRDDPRSVLAVPIVCVDTVWGALELIRAGHGEFDDTDVRLLETACRPIGAALASASLYEQLESAYLRTSEALAGALESKHPSPSGRATAFADQVEAVGRKLGMTADELRALRFAAIFHDIGNVAVPDAILDKSGPLTDSERASVERHAIVGEQILASVEFLAGVRPLVRHAHERWDGHGYPDGLSGDRIPSGARILGVCDAHEAMRHDRPYRPALSEDDARAELAAAAGTQFDADVVRAFLEVAAG